MNIRRMAEAALFALLFALTAVLPVGLILVAVASLFLSGSAGYDDTLPGLARGLARDVRDLGIEGAIPVSVFLLGAGFGTRHAFRGRTDLAARRVGQGTVLALLAVLVLDTEVVDHRAARIAFVLAAAGLTLACFAAGAGAWRAARRARR